MITSKARCDLIMEVSEGFSGEVIFALRAKE